MIELFRAAIRSGHYTEHDVAAAPQNQALSALLFLYQKVLGQHLPWLDELVRDAKGGKDRARRARGA